MSLLSRVRWGNVGRALALLGAVALVVAWPRLAPQEPELPPPAPAPVMAPSAPAEEQPRAVRPAPRDGLSERELVGKDAAPAARRRKERGRRRASRRRAPARAASRSPAVRSPREETPAAPAATPAPAPPPRPEFGFE